ncbi:carboxymuconolactone decarboxylase family protein [Streptomyces lavendulae]|uniref:carboxymuconolactone decarboxylase family protein n=1 Tax=Streptomyces lavendulae TaxID=1914 RepID=UPI00368C6426
MSFDRLYAQGCETFAALVPGGKERLEEIFRVSPALAELAVGTVYGHLGHRPALDPRLREAAALAAIIASGVTGTPLAVHVRTGLAAGLAPTEILEVVLETAAFSGFPRAVAALPVIEKVFRETEVRIPPERSPRQIVLDVIDAVRHEEATAGSGTVPCGPWAECLAPGADISVCTTAPDQAIVVIALSGVQSDPEVVLHVRVEQDRVVQVTRLPRQPANEADTDHAPQA